MAPDESIPKVVEDLPARQSPGRAAEVSVSVGLIYQLVGIGTLLAGSGLLLAVLTGHKRLLRNLGIGIGPAPEVALLLIGLGVLILLRESLQTPTSDAPPEPADDEGEKEKGGAEAPPTGERRSA